MQVTPKALPSSGSLAVINKSISRTKLTNFKPTSSTTEEGGKTVKSIESKIITIDKVIESKTLFLGGTSQDFIAMPPHGSRLHYNFMKLVVHPYG